MGSSWPLQRCISGSPARPSTKLHRNGADQGCSGGCRQPCNGYACEAVRRVLDVERKKLLAAALQLPEIPEGTAVHDLLSHLTSLTRPADLEKLASLSGEEIKRIDELRKRLRDLKSDDPEKAARIIEIRAKRLETLATKIRKLLSTLGDGAIAELFSARDRMASARRAAEEVRRGTFEEQPLPNTGSDAWRTFWAAAEHFSTTDAYPGRAFPVTEPDARCLLCQQQLTTEGTERLRRFHEFLSSEAQRKRDDAIAQFQRLRTAVDDLVVLDEPTNEALAELQLEDSDLADQARAFIETANQRRSAVVEGLAEDGTSSSSLPSMMPEPVGLNAHVEGLRARVGELRKTNRTELIGRLESELRELEARQVLAEHLTPILEEIERKKRIAAFQLCLDETKTTAITRKSTEVTKLAVTEQLAKSFREELETLKFRHVEVEMVAAGGARGALYHRLQLRRAPGVSVPKVVSEGEARCLSIASFFAELCTAADRSAILFDDPVSSLDHNWRANVAQRLVEESKSRQVVVFTHDIVFLVAMTEHAEQAAVEVNHQHLRRGYTTAGLTEEGPPFPGMKVSARIGYLKNLMQAAAKLYRENKPQEYEQAGTKIYRLLRQAWERAIEEVLLNGVVERYRKSVETQRAKHLGDIGEADCQKLGEGMTKCSKWEGGHDHSAAEASPFPAPDEIEKDIKALDDWVNDIRKRRRK